MLAAGNERHRLHGPLPAGARQARGGAEVRPVSFGFCGLGFSPRFLHTQKTHLPPPSQARPQQGSGTAGRRSPAPAGTPAKCMPLTPHMCTHGRSCSLSSVGPWHMWQETAAINPLDVSMYLELMCRSSCSTRATRVTAVCITACLPCKLVPFSWRKARSECLLNGCRCGCSRTGLGMPRSTAAYTWSLSSGGTGC